MAALKSRFDSECPRAMTRTRRSRACPGAAGRGWDLDRWSDSDRNWAGGRAFGAVADRSRRMGPGRRVRHYN